MTEPRKYRKKPVVIEAMQWDGTPIGATEVINWILDNGGTARLVEGDAVEWGGNAWRLHIDTLEGVMRADSGDFIIRGVQNEYYPCKPDIFNQTYEEVSDVADEHDNDEASTTPSGVVLTNVELESLARRLAASKTIDGDWLTWDDVPELDESSWFSLSDMLVRIGQELYLQSRNFDTLNRVDSIKIYKRVQ